VFMSLSHVQPLGNRNSCVFPSCGLRMKIHQAVT
jgi:hypothetical protein